MDKERIRNKRDVFYEIDINPSLQDPLDGYVTLGRAAFGRVSRCG
jgi:hypothetical protein